jgi:AraC family transcriptional regulator of adaptative response/methylated-DNA-[protein]-cysteine methyltransferase
MSTQQELNYKRIAEAIEFIRVNFKSQPSLEQVAESVHLSPFHFQRLFNEWAGTTPKKFLQYISMEHAKKLLKEELATLSDAAYQTGLSGTSRLHDLFIKIEGMTPAEYKNGGQDLHINYSFAGSPFGTVLIASTLKGICHLAFEEDESNGLKKLRAKFLNARFTPQFDELQQSALDVFKSNGAHLSDIKLHLKGSVFQLKVWEALLRIPMGALSTYGALAKEIESPTAARAVGTAIGSNPVAFLIPCHRVIQSSGNFGGYMWGPNRKTAIIGWENVKTYEPVRL